MKLSNKKIVLRPLKLEDAYEVFLLIDDSRKQLTEFLPWAKDIYDVASEQKALKKNLADAKILMFVIEVNQKIVGLIDLHELSFKNKTSQIGYFLGTPYTGYGYMSQSVKLLEEYAFKTLKLNTLKILTAKDNNKSQAVALRCAYVKQQETSKHYIFIKSLVANSH